MSGEYMQVYPLQGETIHDTDKGRFRVTVERIEPEPEKRWWRLYCQFESERPGKTDIMDMGCSGPGPCAIWYRPESHKLLAVHWYMHSTTEPTLAEFAAAVKEATGVEIPVREEEEPQWWWWNGEEWRGDDSCPRYAHTGINMFGRLVCTVYGTKADRNIKRDALLEAARKAGKP